jgi:predicted DNA-binding transcriptional regulator AlpA
MAPELKRALQRRAQGGPPDKTPDPYLAAQDDKNLADADRDPAPVGRGPKYIPPQHAPQRDRGGVVAAPRGPPLTGRRFLSYADLVDRGIRFSRPHLRRLENSGDFPARVELGFGNGVQTSAAWVAVEIERWEDSRIAHRDERLRLRTKQPDAGAPAA